MKYFLPRRLPDGYIPRGERQGQDSGSVIRIARTPVPAATMEGITEDEGGDLTHHEAFMAAVDRVINAIPLVATFTTIFAFLAWQVFVRPPGGVTQNITNFFGFFWGAFTGSP